MSYYMSKTLDLDFDVAKAKVVENLKSVGFGILSEIDVQAVLKKKINADIYRYEILGACNPEFAHKAILAEDKIGIMLPCNIILQQKDANSGVEVSAVDPLVSMAAVKNPALEELAKDVQGLLQEFMAKLDQRLNNNKAFSR